MIKHNQYQELKNVILGSFKAEVEVEGGPIWITYSTDIRPRPNAVKILQNTIDLDFLSLHLIALFPTLPEGTLDNLQEDIANALMSADVVDHVQDLLDDITEIDLETEVELDQFPEYLEQIKDPMEKDILTELWFNLDLDLLKHSTRKAFEAWRM